MKTKTILIGIAVLGVFCQVNRITAQPNQSVFVLQGLQGTTLVAGKTTGLRVFTDDAKYTAADRIEATILRPDGSTLVKSWSRSDIVAIPTGSLGRNLLVQVPGSELPWVGSYTFDVKVFDAAGGLITSHSLEQTQLLPTKDLRFLVTYLFKGDNPGAFRPTPTWDADVQRSMARLGSMFPVRDGVQSALNGDLRNGLRYWVGTPCDGYVQGYYDCVYQQTRTINSSAGDHVDITIEFRPGFYNDNPCREVPCGPGGNSARPPAPYSDLHRAGCVAGNFNGIEMTAPCFAQESGHNFGLEPSSSPHYQDLKDPGHSKDPFIKDPDAFDFLNNRAYSVIGDVMNNLGSGALQGANAVMFNAFDWEYLRQQILKLSSTGPTLPAHFNTQTSAAVTGVGNSIYFFSRRKDNRVYFNYAKLGEAGVGWAEVQGDGRTDVAPAAGAVGTHVYVAIKGLDGNLYLNQADLGKPFGQWLPLNFASDEAPGVVGVEDNVYFFAKRQDGRIFFNRAKLGQGGVGWAEVQGNGRTDATPAAGAVGNHVYVAIKGLDGKLYLNQADLGHPFGQWFPLNFASEVAPGLAGVGDNAYFFAKRQDGRIFFDHAKLGQGGAGWAEVQGDGRTDAAPAAGAVGRHVFLAIKGLDGGIYLNQADAGQPFGQWFP